MDILNALVSYCLVADSRPSLCDPLHCNPPGSSVHRISQAALECVACFFVQGDLFDTGIKPASPTLAGGFSTAELLGSPL